ARERGLRPADARLSGVGRIFDDPGRGPEWLARRREGDEGKSARLQARRRRRDPHLFRPARGREARTRALMATIALAEIEAAQRVIAGHVLRTPTLPSPRLSALTGVNVCVKCENLQATGSFKEHGAFNKLASLSDTEKKRGVVAMSAGNHAQAVAYHATRMGIASTIIMPEPTPYVKVAATEAHGARVVLHGETISDAEHRAMRFVADDGLVLVHPYDDPKVIAGQGTIALEMLEDVPDLDMLVVPVGGGGLIAGITSAT